MVITGKKRWFVLFLVSVLGGIMVYLPFLRYSYYDQMVVLFTQYKQIVDASTVNDFIGTFALWYGVFTTVGYIFGGILVDKFGEKRILILGCFMMGACALWFGFVPDETSILVIHILYGIATSFFIWGAYLKLVRKLGKASEQGKMFSVSEFVRNAIVGTSLGFLGVALMNAAVVPSGSLDPAALGAAWMVMHWIDGFMMIGVAIALIFILPNHIIGAEEKEDEEKGVVIRQETISIKTAAKILKMPGAWLLAFLIFFCFSFTSAANGYLGSYTVNVLGISPTEASTLAIVRNYIIAGLSTLAIGFIADKIGFKSKTLGIYLVAATVLVALMLITKNINTIACIATIMIFAIVYTGMRGIYFAALNEVGIPLPLTGVGIGIISTFCYLPDVYFAKLAGFWLDTYGNFGYDLIWYWCIGCGILGVITAIITVRYATRIQKPLSS